MTKPKKNDVSSIVEELCNIDPSLRKHGDALADAVRQLLASRPNASLDDAFVKDLRTRLEHALTAPSAPQKRGSFLSRLGKKPTLFLYPAGGFVIVAVIAAMITASPANGPVDNGTRLADGVQVIALADGAFGDLSGTQGGDSMSATATPAPRGLGGGGGLNLAMDADVKRGASSVTGSAMIAPEEFTYVPTEYRFVYQYDALPAPEPRMAVYRQRTGQGLAAAFSGLLAAADFGVMDLGALDALTLQSFSAYEDKDKGYMIYANLDEGSISLSQNYLRWPHPELDCRDTACYERLQPSVETMPPDDRLIGAAEAFLRNYGISLEGYGEGVVTDDWRVRYETAAVKSEIYLPTVVNVTFPLTIDGKTAYVGGGTPHGLMVSIDVRTLEVTNVANIRPPAFERSDYAMETDVGRLLKLALQGGTPYFTEPSEGSNVVEVFLGTPELVMMQVYVPQAKGDGTQIFVPAYSFPVERTSDGSYYWSSSILVPLAKDILDSQYTVSPGLPTPMPVDLPLIIRAEETGAGEGGVAAPDVIIGLPTGQ